jgi:hypothetical protein
LTPLPFLNTCQTHVFRKGRGVKGWDLRKITLLSLCVPMLPASGSPATPKWLRTRLATHAWYAATSSLPGASSSTVLAAVLSSLRTSGGMGQTALRKERECFRTKDSTKDSKGLEGLEIRLRPKDFRSPKPKRLRPKDHDSKPKILYFQDAKKNEIQPKTESVNAFDFQKWNRLTACAAG